MSFPLPLAEVCADRESMPSVRSRVMVALLVARITPCSSSSINSNLSFSSNCSTVRRRAWPRLSEVSLASPAVPVACKRPAMVEKRLSAARCTPPYSSR